MAIPIAGYVTPPFPSLFIPWLGTEQSLYYREDIIYFTLIWTLIWFSLVYGTVALRSGAVLFGQRKGMFFVLGMGAYGLVSGALSGAIVGLVLFKIYDAGNFPMPTWVPLLWGLIQVLIVVISSYSNIALTAL